MRRRHVRGVARRTRGGALVAVTALLAVAACGSSSGKTKASGDGEATGSTAASAPTGGSSGKTITVGVIADVTGLAASSSKTALQGIKAGVIYAKR
jgi:branched-chain amino acid transport system substrate-binding protein